MNRWPDASAAFYQQTPLPALRDICAAGMMRGMNEQSSPEIQNPAGLPDARARAACAWAEQALGRGALAFSIASADASFRRYFRAGMPASAESWIVMDAPPVHENLAPFIDISARFVQAGLNAPRVLAENIEQGFLLLTDLGQQTFLEAHSAGADIEPLMQSALEALAQIQARVPATGLPDYDRALLQRELDLYPDWYLGRHRSVTLTASEQATWRHACELLVDAALRQPQVFVHRDYMLRNLMVSDPMPGVIDFQDAVRGPVTYDLLSLCKDAFVSWPGERVAQWLSRYVALARDGGVRLPEDFERSFDWMGLQRHLKVIGIFARLNYRDGKSKYLAETPRFFRYVYQAAKKYPEFDDLVSLMQKYEAPA